MARRRMLDPNFWDDEDVCSLPDRERLLLICCISNADDEGKLSGSAATIKKIAFGMTDTTIQEVEEMLEHISCVIRGFCRYEVEGKTYIKLMHWGKYQRVDHPYASIIPEPVENDSENGSKNDSENGSKNETRQLNNQSISNPLSNQSSESDLIDSDLLRKKKRIQENVLNKQPMMRADLIHQEIEVLLAEYTDINECVEASGIMAAQSKTIPHPFTYIKTVIDNKRKDAAKTKEPEWKEPQELPPLPPPKAVTHEQWERLSPDIKSRIKEPEHACTA